MFGEPSRDFLDSPIFSFGGPRICPWDLFAAQYNDWKIEDQNEIARLRKRLEEKKAAILLTAQEGKFLNQIREAEDEDPFLGHRELWWVRTLRSPMSIEDEIMVTMKLFSSSYGEETPMPELREVYRRKLLPLFKKAMEEQKIQIESRLRYQYLHAEFLRKGGKAGEALKEFVAFDQRLGAIPEKERGKHEPLVTWTKEQILRIELKTADLKSLMKNLRLPLANPFRDEEEWGEGDWLRHRWGLEELVRRCLEGNQEASGQLWNLMGRDAGKLLSAAETISFPSLDRFAKAGPRWEEWRGEMAGQLKEGKTPKGAVVGVNQERNVNLLLRIVGGEELDPMPFLPLPSSPENEGEDDTADERLRVALKVMEEGAREEGKRAVIGVLEELRALDWRFAKKETMYDYPLQYLSREFARSGDRYQAEMEASLAKAWKDPFFKEMVRLWLGKPDALAKLEETEALQTKPKYPGYGPAQMVYFYFEATKDPAWKQRCVRDLENLDMLNDRVFYYAKAIMSPELEKVLLERHAKITAFIEKETFKEEDWDWRPGEASDIEGFWREMQLARMPLRLMK
jgi:hypothetical protein